MDTSIYVTDHCQPLDADLVLPKKVSSVANLIDVFEDLKKGQYRYVHREVNRLIVELHKGQRDGKVTPGRYNLAKGMLVWIDKARDKLIQVVQTYEKDLKEETEKKLKQLKEKTIRSQESKDKDSFKKPVIPQDRKRKAPLTVNTEGQIKTKKSKEKGLITPKSSEMKVAAGGPTFALAPTSVFSFNGKPRWNVPKREEEDEKPMVVDSCESDFDGTTDVELLSEPSDDEEDVKPKRYSRKRKAQEEEEDLRSSSGSEGTEPSDDDEEEEEEQDVPDFTKGQEDKLLVRPTESWGEDYDGIWDGDGHKPVDLTALAGKAKEFQETYTAVRASISELNGELQKSKTSKKREKENEDERNESPLDIEVSDVERNEFDSDIESQMKKDGMGTLVMPKSSDKPKPQKRKREDSDEDLHSTRQVTSKEEKVELLNLRGLWRDSPASEPMERPIKPTEKTMPERPKRGVWGHQITYKDWYMRVMEREPLRGHKCGRENLDEYRNPDLEYYSCNLCDEDQPLAEKLMGYPPVMRDNAKGDGSISKCAFEEFNIYFRNLPEEEIEDDYNHLTVYVPQEDDEIQSTLNKRRHWIGDNVYVVKQDGKPRTVKGFQSDNSPERTHTVRSVVSKGPSKPQKPKYASPLVSDLSGYKRKNDVDPFAVGVSKRGSSY